MHPDDYWPNSDHSCLLMAALGAPVEAHAAWLRWSAQNKMTMADAASRRLLPLVYHNLSQTGDATVDLSALRLESLRTHVRNKSLFEVLDRVLGALGGNSVPTMLLKGAALSLHVYNHAGLRPMTDLDVAVPYDMAERALAALSSQCDFCAEPGASLSPLEEKSVTLKNAEGVELDLHFSPFHGRFPWRAIEPLWATATPLSFRGRQTLILSPSDQLLHTLAHGARFNRLPGVRWVADAMWIMRQSEDLAWDAFLMRAEHLRLSIVSAKMLRYLKVTHQADVPQGVLDALNKRISMYEILDYAKRRSLVRRAGVYAAVRLVKSLPARFQKERG